MRYRTWLYDSSYSPSALNQYGVVARLIFSLLPQPYLEIDPEADLDRVHAYVDEHYDRAWTRREYHKAIRKFEQFLCRCLARQPRLKPLNWSLFTGELPAWLAESVREFLAHRRRSWQPENEHRRSIGLLSQLTAFPRWLAQQGVEMQTALDFTPKRWFAYVDARLQLAPGDSVGVSPTLG